ncbi:MAG: type IV toxin-antitoxin system AbiEi family antitoxin [Gemmatimonadales bacterium]
MLTPRAYQRLVQSHRESWQVPASAPLKEVTRFLESANQLAVVNISRRPGGGETAGGGGFTRYLVGAPSEHAVALSLRGGSYLSHATAVFLHGLSVQIPRSIHVNREQSPKPRPQGSLSQESIDRAFQSKPRTTTYEFEFRGFRLVLLNGKSTGRFGVMTLTVNGEALEVTDLERTLVDIAVRPVYSGGPLEVAKVYREASRQVAVEKLVATLTRLDYIYPYHQSLGFYLQRAGIPSHVLSPLRALGLHHDFYLANQIHNPAYDREWRLFYPAEIKLLD